MELDKKLLEEIAAIFRGVEFGKITFYITPDKWQLNYAVETSGKLALEKPAGGKPKVRVVRKKKEGPPM